MNYYHTDWFKTGEDFPYRFLTNYYVSERALETKFSVQVHCHSNLLQSPEGIGLVVLMLFWFIIKKKRTRIRLPRRTNSVCRVYRKKILQSWPRIFFPLILAYNEKFAWSMFIAIRISFNHGCGSAFLQSRLTMRSLLGGGERLMELLWHNGQVVTQRVQNQRPFTNLNNGGCGGGDIPFLHSASTTHAIATEEVLVDDEMSAWLQFPIDDLQGDILLSHPTAPQHETTRSGVITEELFRPLFPLHSPYTPFVPYRPPSSIAAAGPSTICSTDVEGIAASAPKFQSFLNYSWVPKAIVRQEYRVTPAARKSVQLSGWNVGGPSGAASTSNNAGKEFATACEPTVTASLGASTASGSVEGRTPPVPHKLILSNAEGKRRERELNANDCQNDDDDDHRSGEKKKKSWKPTSVKRSRAAEVHNLSERKRRAKINAKLRALQKLIPNSNKKDISSMLDEAIEYIKSLQLQAKTINMGGCGMVPMMYPGTQE